LNLPEHSSATASFLDKLSSSLPVHHYKFTLLSQGAETYLHYLGANQRFASQRYRNICVYERANDWRKVGSRETSAVISKAIFKQLFVAYSLISNDSAVFSFEYHEQSVQLLFMISKVDFCGDDCELEYQLTTMLKNLTSLAVSGLSTSSAMKSRLFS
jgi:hypothetical protein